MAEYIERNAVKAAVRKRLNSSLIIGWLISIINEIPAADVAHAVHGDWYGCGNMWMCTVCDDLSYTMTNYCPNCGARMDGE